MRLYDTLSGEKRDFAPLGEKVTMYVCGPNLYGPCHIGHALSYIVFDVLRRYLEHRDYEVHHVQNFTDIEDRIIEVSQRDDRSIGELAEHYIQRFHQEMDALGILRAHDYPRATDYIDRMIEIVQRLIANGHAYALDGDVYFRVRAFESYGQLSKRPLDEMRSGTRIEVDQRKEDSMDFALWKASKEGEPAWPSPWGPGRPGWHIECTAMSLSLLGDHVDIHGGGQDVIFPHHENEIAQSEVYTGKAPFVRFWIHNGLLRLQEGDEEKMTRHRGNIVSCQQILEQYKPDAIRLFLLSSHYRSPITYTDDGIASAERALERLVNALRAAPSDAANASMDAAPFQDRFRAAMDDDLNTPQAIATLFDMAREINRDREAGMAVGEAQDALQEMASVLGLSLEERRSSGGAEVDAFVDLLVETRSQLRAERNWKQADAIRDRLEELGVVMEDSSAGTQWRFRGPQ